MLGDNGISPAVLRLGRLDLALRDGAPHPDVWRRPIEFDVADLKSNDLGNPHAGRSDEPEEEGVPGVLFLRPLRQPGTWEPP